MSVTDFPVGSTVATTVYSIGDRSEEVTGTVAGYMCRDRFLVVDTTTHGQLSVEPAKARRTADAVAR